VYDWKSVLLIATNTIEEAINVLDRESLRIVLVIDDQSRLIGTVTDGDIRRGLIKGCGMSTHLNMIMFRNPTTASVEDDKESILALMKNRSLLQVPLVDGKGCVVGLESLHGLIQGVKHDNPVVLMAGGFGKRLRPLTDDTPKTLLKVGTKPILEIILDQFINSGFHKFFISIQYKAEAIRAYFGDGSRWGVHIEYMHEAQPLGTAGSLGLLPTGIPNLPIVIMNGDLLTKVNFGRLLQFHHEQGGAATMCVRKYDFQVPYGVVESEGQRISKIVEKPIHSFFVNAGIYVLNPEVVRLVDGINYLNMPTLLEGQIDKGGQVNMFPLHEYWLDIGQMNEYEQAQKDIISLFS